MSILDIPLGINTSNKVIKYDLTEAPHLLVAGTTGSGKSTFIHAMLCALLSKNTPDDLLIHLTDTKMVELDIYRDIPHLLAPVATDAYEAVDHFQALVSMMNIRYEMVKESGSRSLEEFNNKVNKNDKLPYILVVVDEVADLIMVAKKDIEESIVRIAQKARAVGIHLVLATQSPRRDVISGLLKCNLPSRIAFSTSSELDSRIILDYNGAGNLTGLGDGLFSDQGNPPIRFQAPYISSNEINSIVSHWKSQNLALAA